jgi:hypothetical protein
MNQGQLLIGIPFYSGKLYCFEDFLRSLENLEYNGIEPLFVFLECDITENNNEEMRDLLRDFMKRNDFHGELYKIPKEFLLNPKTVRKKRYINTFARDTLLNLLNEPDYKNCNFHLMIDPDIILPKNGLTEMFACIEAGADISTILCQMHFFQQATYIIHRQVRYFEFRNFKKWEIDEMRHIGAHVIEVDNATTALMLITREVYKQLFNIRYIEGLIWGHDVIFSQDARVLGFKIMCSLYAEALHLQPQATYEKMKDANLIDLWLT